MGAPVAFTAAPCQGALPIAVTSRGCNVPLTFTSLSHGSIAFGFFHIETQMLLMENRFFWAEAFCNSLSLLSQSEPDTATRTSFSGYCMSSERQAGDLMAAIHGVRYTGFFGDLYRRCPFPKDPQPFKQKPIGQFSGAMVAKRILRYGSPCEIEMVVSAAGGEAAIGLYRFDRTEFQELIRYVWRGGYPRWQNEHRPGYVVRMQKAVESSRHALFKGIIVEN
jgi:hypothetical protein